MPINRNAVQVGVLVAVGNLLIFQHFMPPVSDVKQGDQFNSDLEGSERTALLISVAFTSLVAGFVRSWDTFLTAGIVIVGVDFAYKHANAIHPDTGTMQAPSGGSLEDGGSVHPLPSYADMSSDTGS